MTRGIRDRQRSAVYEWERVASRETGRATNDPTWERNEEVADFLAPVWRAERGRVGLAWVVAPEVKRPARGQRSALAHSTHVLSFPRWARGPWVALHELAHRLTPKDEAHGARFVGVLIGLLARHDGRDAHTLMRLADERGVKYHVRSIGVVPQRGIADWIRTALPGTPVEIAVALNIEHGLDLHHRQVRGAALHLIRAGVARFRGPVLVSTVKPAPIVAPQPAKPRRAQSVRRLEQGDSIDGKLDGWPCTAFISRYPGMLSITVEAADGSDIGDPPPAIRQACESLSCEYEGSREVRAALAAAGFVVDTAVERRAA